MATDSTMQVHDDALPLILITNDDGIQARGIKALVEALDGLGQIWVVAPEDERSGTSHAITLKEPLRVRTGNWFEQENVHAFSVSGNPVDCVKMGVYKICPRRPDLVVSGINQGPNSAINVIYSGTVGGGLEGAVQDIPSLALSLVAWRGGSYETSKHVARRLAEMALRGGVPEGVVLNVNIPELDLDELKGYRVVRQARSRWEESFEERIDPFGRPYHWLTGQMNVLDDGDDTDLVALEAGYVSVTPIRPDITSYKDMPAIEAALMQDVT